MTWQARLQQVLESWRGTPWMAGQCLRGPRGGVDCVRFVTAVLDELHRLELPPVARLPQDMSLHDRHGAMRVARAIESRYPHTLVDPRAAVVEPGDVLVFRTGALSGPGHVTIAGCNSRQLWHASFGVDVCTTSLRANNEVIRIWRPTGREQW